MKLAPEWLALEEQWGSRPSISGTIEEIRASYDGLSKQLADAETTPPDPSVHVRDEVIYGGLTLRIFTPKESHEEKQTLPIGVYAHGGGYAAGGINTYFEDRLCRYVCQFTPCVLVSVAYRRAPEYPVPAQLYDYVGAFNWVWKNAESLGGSQDNIFSIGASIGGTLAIGVALKYLEYGMKGRVRGVVALAPMTIHPEHVPEEFKPHLTAWEENHDGAIISFEGMMLFAAISGSTAQKKNPDVFVGLHERLGEMPPTYVATCGADVIRDDGTVIKVALDKAGVPCKLDNYEEMPHFFWIFKEIATGDTFRENVVKGARWVLKQEQRNGV